jgi:alpha-tubulin suppressor-like RCC1 family protein
MAYSENGSTIDVTTNVNNAGYVTKKYLFDAYPQLTDQAKSAGLWLWGSNFSGEIGDRTQINKSSPVQTISGGANWKQISGGYTFFGGIKTDGSLWMWGANDSTGGYALGDGATGNKSSPIQTSAGGTSWKMISCGYYHTAATKIDGTLWVWGLNANGQLGTNGTLTSTNPRQTIATATTWKVVSAGKFHNAAIKTDGTLWLWGGNSYGQIGDNTNGTDRLSPVQTISGGTNWKLASSGKYHTAAIKTDGTLWLWGSSNYGQIGDNTTTAKSSPIQTIAGGTNWKYVVATYANTYAIKTDGTLWAWGWNYYGGIGNNTNTITTGLSISSPVQTIASGTNWKSVVGGINHAVAIKTDGTLWTWGRNIYGQLGNNSSTDLSSPVQTVAGGSNWKLIACGRYETGAIKDFNEDF